MNNAFRRRTAKSISLLTAGFRMPTLLVGMVVFLVGTLLSLSAPHGSGAPPQKVSADHVRRAKAGLKLFRERVRPVLIKQCLKCHGGETIEGDFDLSSRKALMESGMVEKDAKSSHLFDVISHTEEPYMPKKAAKLSAKTIADIARWIDLGVPYDKPLAKPIGHKRKPAMTITRADRNFWSFRPLSAPRPPAVRHRGWVRTPIDRFVLARQEAKRLHPNPSADRQTLIRRAYFDLIGLPPTPKEVDAFIADPDPLAYEKLIDRLLASPHYGECWAPHWMDIARFAESFGYEQDYDRPDAYHYRDFLIKAFNSDMPYDRFVRWQIAGDEAAPNNPLAMMATGFLGGGAFPTQLTETEFESSRYEELDDMTRTTAEAFLGLTIGCARCHDHKFDPIASSDYYRLISTFTTTIRSRIEVDIDPKGYQQSKDLFDKEHAPLVAALKKYESQQLPAHFDQWLNRQRTGDVVIPRWRVLNLVGYKSTGGAKLTKLDDDSILATGRKPDHDMYVFTARTRMRDIRAICLETLTHRSLVKGGPGRAQNGNFALTDLQVLIRPLSKPKSKPVPAKMVAARATHEQNRGLLSVRGSIDEGYQSGWAVDLGGIGHAQAAVFDFANPIGFAGGTELTIVMKFSNNVQHSIGRARLSITTQSSPRPVTGKGIPQQVAAALATLKRRSLKDLSKPDREVLLHWYARSDAAWRKLRKVVENHLAREPKPGRTMVQVTADGFKPMKHHADGRGFPHFYPQTYILNRGDVKQKKGVATQGFLPVLMRGGKQMSHWKVRPPTGWKRTTFRRTALANWLTDVRYGAGNLAARVIVNRLWQHHFGRGLVATPNDFGYQGDRPTHPRLLDWLANDLVTHGWRMKRLQRLMMTSAVYMQNSRFDEDRARIDRENRLLWRRTPRRLEGEAIRDAMLLVADRLDPQMYGPGTLDQNMSRRSVYFFIKRSKLIPMLMLFDWPEHLVSIGQRNTTTIAPQALMFMNSPQGRRYAELFADRLGNRPVKDMVRRAYRLALGRSPDAAEQRIAAAFIARQTASYRQSKTPHATQLALTDFCQTLLSLNEFAYVD